MEPIVIVGSLVALALAAARWGVDSREVNMNVVEMELALERARELRASAARRPRRQLVEPRPAKRSARASVQLVAWTKGAIASTFTWLTARSPTFG